jgi:hypothetical protein
LPITIWKRTSYGLDEEARLARVLAIDLLSRYAAWILTVCLVKGKAVEDSQEARQEVLLPAYRVTSNPEVIGPSD